MEVARNLCLDLQQQQQLDRGVFKTNEILEMIVFIRNHLVSSESDCHPQSS